jgi:hypothetical protein
VLRLAPRRVLGRRPVERLDLVALQQREVAQQPPHVGVVGVHPELEELVRRRALGSSHTDVPAAVLPNFVPSRLSRSGKVSTCADSPSIFRISSVPAVMFPHWSLPPTCSVTPWRRRSSTKSYDWRSMYENSVYEIPSRAGSARSPCEHHVHREVLADVAQQVDRAERARATPGCRSPRGGRALEVEEALELPPIAAAFSATTSRAFSCRSADRPLGSPMSPVPPPTSATGRCPCS